jgi:hypothetical protein
VEWCGFETAKGGDPVSSYRFRGIVGGVALTLFVGCNEKLTEPPIVALHHDPVGSGGGASDAGHVVPPPECVGKCCPAAPECYPENNPSSYSGAECLAQRDNTNEKHWQFRQTLSVSTKPPGIAGSTIASFLAQRSELNWPACNAPNGTSGFIQLIDIDREHDTSRVGFARFASDAKTALAEGLCFVEDTYDDPKWVLPAIPPPTGWPVGLSPPKSLPFKVKPVTAVRYKDAAGNFVDFDLDHDRQEILKRLDPDLGDLKEYGGIFFFDETRGYLHGYAPVTFILNYDSATAYNAIPIRESEIKTQLNDADHPNCAGAYLGDNLSLPASCAGNSTNRAWGCAKGACGDGASAQTTVEGYFLITELEQVYNGLLDQSLCYLFPGPDLYPGWNLTKSCRSDTARWDPTRADGIPPGDWCAEENSAATGSCHDAWKSVSFSTFQAFPIQEGTCTAK